MLTSPKPLGMVAVPVLAVLSASTVSAQQFEEVDGYVVMEAESVPTGSQWTDSSDLGSIPNTTFLEGAVGSYYQYTGDNNICSGAPDGPLSYTFRIGTAGMYELNIRMAKIWHCVTGTRWEDEPENPARPPAHTHECREGGGFDRGCERLGTPDEAAECPDTPERLCLRVDLSNDVYVAIRTAAGDFVPYEGRRADDDRDQVKFFYGGGADQFDWSNRIDQGGSPRFVEAVWDLAAGDYELVVWGRSRDCRVDRLILTTERFDNNRARRRALDERLTETLSDPGSGDTDAGTGSGATDGGSAGATRDGGSSTGGDDGDGSSDSGCSVGLASSELPGGLVVALALLLWRRRLR